MLLAEISPRKQREKKSNVIFRYIYCCGCDLQWAAVLFVYSYAETRNINHLDRMNNRASKTQKKPLIKIGPVTIWNRVILAALPGASGQCSGCAAAHVIFWT